ncbi:MAG TPA: hypothetical protein VIP11_07090, partial [Gemmatimonadaceae bacterium]
MDAGAGASSRHGSRILAITLLVVLGIGATMGFRYYLRPGDQTDNESLGRLARIVGPHRIARARLTGGFAYATCQTDSSSNGLVRGLVCDGSKAARANDRLRKLAAEMRSEGANGGTPDAHTTGVWNLVSGSIDDAVARLREVVRHEPSNAGAFNDLAVALTEFAERHDSPAVLVDAFIAVDSAVRLDSTLKEARFTHAVVLEHLYLRADAIEAWNRYLALDRRSPWADEAKNHIAALQPNADSAKQWQTRLRRAAAASDSGALQTIVAENPADAHLAILIELGKWGRAFEE